jgi:hypothetical protein
MKTIGLLLFLLITNTLFAQCLEGDCKNGYGKYDLFYAIYEGTFVNGIPNGAGKLFYDDYTYEGEIKEGVEHGRGVLIYKDGSIEKVKYNMGKKIKDLFVKEDASKWKSYEAKRDKNCISGDCANGFGKYQFSSGNVYEGPFVDFQPEGNGKWYFTNGDKYFGVVKDGLKNGQGTYYFKNGWTFSGTYVKDTEYNGTYTTDKGQTVKVASGKIVMPKPSVTYTITSGGPLRDPNHRRCPMCSGKGEMTIPGKTTVVRSAASKVLNTGGASSIDYGVHSVSMPDRKEKCSYCSGTGVIKM